MESIFQKHLSNLIAQSRCDSLRSLSQATGIPRSTLHGLLNGAQPSLKTANELAEFFGVSVDYLVFGRLGSNPLEQMVKVGDKKALFEITIKKVS